MKNIVHKRASVPISFLALLIFAFGKAAVALAVTQAEPASAGKVPAPIAVDAGHEPFARYKAVGTQQYVCLPKGDTFAWTLFGPQATLFDGKGNQVLTHFLSGNPQENRRPRPTWQSSRDSSAVCGEAIASSSDPHFVALDAIPWLLLRAVGAQPGQNGSDVLKQVTYIQRINTAGGDAPVLGCTMRDEVGMKALVPYTADYVFYRAAGLGRKP